MNPKNFLPRAPPGSCFVFRPNGPGTTDFISLQGTCGYLPMYVASFNGVNGYVNMGKNTALDVNQLTMQAWVYIFNYTWGAIANKEYYSGGNYYGYRFFVRKLEHVVTFQLGPGGSYCNSWSSVTVPLNTWTHIVVTYDGTNQRIYINGKDTTSGSPTPTCSQIAPAATSFYIGMTDPSLGSTFFNGSIANVQIYNIALTPQEIQYLYQQGLGGGPVRLQNLVAWWPLNGDAKDYSGNNLHGTINGGVTFVQNYNPP
jgi:hypothetical protein